MYPSQLLKGTYQTIILKMLTEHKRMYGYQISQKVKDQSNGAILLPEGSLYPILHKMADQGLVKTEKVLIGSRVRRYYSITATGKSTAQEKIREFERFVETMQGLLIPKTGCS